MAKRLMVLVTVFLSLALLNVVQAVGVDTGPAALAPYFSADTEMFISLRIDNDVIDELDSLLGSVMAKLPADMEIPPVSIRQNLEAALADATTQQGVDFSLDALQTWMGDYAATGVTDILGQSPNARTVIQIRDRGAAEAFADELIAANPEDFAYTRTTVDGVTRYEQPAESNAVVLIDDTTMIITNSESENFSMSLDSSEGFQTTVEALPAESYNILTYINVAAATAESPAPELANIASASVGLTILDNHNLTADIALATTNGVASPITAVDPTFARFLPADTSLLIHSTNLTALYDLTMAQAQRMDAENDLDAQVTGMLSMMGIDLRDDLLSWSTGDYALFGTLDYAGIRNMVFSPNDIPDALPAGFGLLIEATDPAAAHSFAEKLTTIITQLTTNQKSITLSSDSVAGTDVTRLAMQTPMDDGTLLEVAFLFGANDELFFFGSESEITAILQGEAGLDSSARFQQASTYFITEPSSILYTDGPGLIATTVIPLALLGPSIGNVYDNIIEELENPTTANPEPQFVSYQPETDPVQILDAVVSMIESASITSSYSTSGVTLTRAIITLAE